MAQAQARSRHSFQAAFYDLQFSGAVGSGRDLLLFDSGHVFSLAEEMLRDCGIYIHDPRDRSLTLDLQLIVPPGALLKGASRVGLQITIPEEGTRDPVSIETSAGPFVISLKRRLSQTG